MFRAVRTQRPEREQVFDPAAVALRDQGVDTAQSLGLMDTVDAACATELGRLDLVLGQLGQSIELKKAHLEIDSKCSTGSIPQTPASPGSGPSSPPGNRSKILPYRWKATAQESVNKSAQACTVSQRVRAKSLKSQQDVQARQQSMKDLCISTLTAKIAETTALHQALVLRVQKVEEEIAAVEVTLGETEQAHADKSNPKQLAEARIAARMQRPEAERVRDQVRCVRN